MGQASMPQGGGQGEQDMVPAPSKAPRLSWSKPTVRDRTDKRGAQRRRQEGWAIPGRQHLSIRGGKPHPSILITRPSENPTFLLFRDTW